MANLPIEESFEQQSDLTLPLMEDLPFDSDLNFEEADLNFLEHYGDLLETVEVEDIGLITTIQGLSQADESVAQSSILESEEVIIPSNQLPTETEQEQLDWGVKQQTESKEDVSIGWNFDDDSSDNNADVSIGWDLDFDLSSNQATEEEQADISLEWEEESIASESSFAQPLEEEQADISLELEEESIVTESPFEQPLEEEQADISLELEEESIVTESPFEQPLEEEQADISLELEEESIVTNQSLAESIVEEQADISLELEEEPIASESSFAELSEEEQADISLEWEEESIVTESHFEQPLEEEQADISLEWEEESIVTNQSLAESIVEEQADISLELEEESIASESSFAELSEEEQADISLEWEEESIASESSFAELSEEEQADISLEWEEESIVTNQSLAESIVEEQADISLELEEEPIVTESSFAELSEEEQADISLESEEESLDFDLDELETLLQMGQEEELVSTNSSLKDKDEIDELETLLQADENQEIEPTIGYSEGEIPVSPPDLSSQMDELETLLQDDESPSEYIDAQSEQIPNDPVVEELITLLQTENESIGEGSEEMIDWGDKEDDNYSVDLVSMWEESNEDDAMEELLTAVVPDSEEDVSQEYDYDSSAEQSYEQLQDDEYYQTDENNDYGEEMNYAHNDDEDSAIDDIMTAFQTSGSNNDRDEEVYPEEDSCEDQLEEDSYEEQIEYYENQNEMNISYEQTPDWEASYEEHSQEQGPQQEEDDYKEWQSGVSSNDFEIDLDDEDSMIDDIITTFQFGNDNPSTQVVVDEEADAMVAKWQQTEEEFSPADSGMIDWEKIASSKSSATNTPDFESFTASGDLMDTAIRARSVLDKSKTSLKDSINFDDGQDMSLPPLPPLPTTRPTRTEVKPPSAIALPNFADEFYEEERFQSRSNTPQTSAKRKDGIILEDDSDLPYRTQLKSKDKNFDEVEESDWGDLLDDIPPVPDEMFGISEQTAARYANSGVPPQFSASSFEAGDTQPANLAITNPHKFQGVSQTAPTFPETPPMSLRVQQFFENNGRVIFQIGLKIVFVVIPIGLLWWIFSIPRVNKATTVTGLRLGIWRDVRGKNLRSVVLKGENLSGVNFSGADLSGSDLGGANLRGANLSGAKLERVNLQGSTLNLADFTKANLQGANLERAEISKTIFRGANISGVKLSGRTWANNNPPISNRDTRCVNGRPGPCQF